MIYFTQMYMICGYYSTKCIDCSQIKTGPLFLANSLHIFQQWSLYFPSNLADRYWLYVTPVDQCSTETCITTRFELNRHNKRTVSNCQLQVRLEGFLNLFFIRSVAHFSVQNYCVAGPFCIKYMTVSGY